MNPDAFEKVDETEIVISVRNEHLAKTIGIALHKKFPQYDFEINYKSAFISVMVRNGLDDKQYGIVYGYATAMVDIYSALFEKELS